MDATFTLTVNGRKRSVTTDPQRPLLDVLREEFELTGTKYGCGACTVHVNGQPLRSCRVPVSLIDGADVTTVEGLSADNTHPVQQAWLAEQVPQCGYCQSGQIMAVVAFLKNHPDPTDSDIDANLTNICRCGTYERLRRGIHRAAALMKSRG